ncbi:MAG: dicarboxylate/amino acid:cation symporter [Rhodospirillaceae bacterium]
MLRRLANPIVIAMVVGIVVGAICHNQLDPASAKQVASYFSIITDVFIRLIRMIIGPLVFSTLVVGIAHMGDASSLGRIGARTLAWFIGASLVSLFLGLIMVNLLAPGENLGLPLPDATTPSAVQGASLNLREFITHLVPRSFFESMVNNEILQIVVFSAFVGVAAMNQGHHGKVIADLANSAANIMLQITSYVMKAAPLAIFAALSSVVTTQGLDILTAYGRFMGGFYLSLMLLWALLIGAGYLIVGSSIGKLVNGLKAPILLAFSTASSEAAYPKTLEQLERFGVSKRVASFVLPVGYSFNLDGSMMYCTFAVMFIAQAYNIEVTWAHQITMLLLLMITSKGMAGVPRASLVVIAATLTTFNLPEAGLLLILGVDQFLDMGRSATNVVGNAIATTAVARWENELHPEAVPDTEKAQTS